MQCIIKKIVKYVESLFVNASVGHLSSEEEARSLLELDEEIFPDHYVEVEEGLRWWKKYSQGAYSIKVAKKVVGYISFWPLREKCFVKFVNGELRESEITEDDIIAFPESSDEEWWYIGGIVVLPEFRHTSHVKKLIVDSITDWSTQVGNSKRINVCALAYSAEGLALLKRFKFEKVESKNVNRETLPIYKRTLEKGESLILEN